MMKVKLKKKKKEGEEKKMKLQEGLNVNCVINLMVLRIL